MVMNGKVEFRFIPRKKRKAISLCYGYNFFQDVSAHMAIVYSGNGRNQK
jgi:hypothetical protein